MNATIYNGYSGIKTHQFGLDSVSNNIANVNTNGYRANIAEFSSVFANTLDTLNSGSSVTSDFEYGATVASNAIDTSEGSYETADDSPFNMAISGDSWFVVGENQNGSFSLDEAPEAGQTTYFTRAGDFSLDADSYIVNSSGQYLYGIDLGKIADDGTFTLSNDSDADVTALSGTTLEPLQIPDSMSVQPTLTTEASIAVNLNKTDNLKGVDSVFYTINSNDPEDSDLKVFDEEGFRASDMNTLFNSDGDHLDLTANSSMSISVTQGDSTETYNFVYGEGTDTDTISYFTSVGDFVDKIADKTGMTVSINPDDTCVFEFSNVTANGEAQEDMTVSFGTTSDDLREIGITSGNQLIDLLGLSDAEITLEADNAGSIVTTDSFSVPTYTTNVEVYDTSGNMYLMESSYHLTDWSDDSWAVSTLIYNQDQTQIVSEAYSNGVMSFDDDGNPTYTDSSTGESTSSVSFADQTITFTPAGSESLASTNRTYADSGISDSDVDGNTTGYLEDVIIDDNGIIYVQFSNNITEAMGRVGLANFVNDQGLSKVGSNLFEMSYQIVDGETVVTSGLPEAVWDEGGSLKSGTVMQGVLETSNVDFANALTELILIQRGYSASAKSFTTGDELIQEAINMKT